MPQKLEFCLLGPVVVRCGGATLPVARGRQRAVLAVLLLNAGRVVSVSEIAETLWGAAPLPSATVTVRNYVKRLRRVLGDADQARIITRSPGYMIRVDPGELDALALFRAAGFPLGEAHVLGNLGELELQQGRYLQAAGHLQRSLGLGRETGNRLSQARALAGLGLCELRQGRHRQAIGHLRQSLALHRQAGNSSGQAEALNGLGEAFLAASQAGQASARHTAALALAIQCGDQHEQARAQRGLASAGQATGGSGRA